jgi:3-phosphoshikimate 1-carboxyvinyltransferase
VVHGVGWEGLREPDDVIDVRNAGTLIRLLPGLIASCPFLVILTGDASIRRRPMARILQPLRAMGVEAWGRDEGRLPPLVLRGGPIRGIEHRMEVASAQVKSCIILAGLRAAGETVVVEPGPTRDHTERLLRLGGAHVEREGPLTEGGRVCVSPLSGPLDLSRIPVPGDLSSAAFPLVAALLVPDSRVTVRDVGLNPTRTGLLDVLRAMGARLTITPQSTPAGTATDAATDAGEPLGDILAEASELSAVEIGGGEVALMVDEVPAWALAAARAKGVSRLRGAGELRVKESDRLRAIAALLRDIGVAVSEREDGLDIEGCPEGWAGGRIRTHEDHRIAMMGAVAGLASRKGVTLDDTGCIAVSYPAFADTMAALAGRGTA